MRAKEEERVKRGAEKGMSSSPPLRPDCYYRPDALALRYPELAAVDFHLISVEDLCQRFTLSRKIGLESEQAARRLATNGPNKISAPPKNLLKK
jgi:hypothetical protein